MIFCTTNASTMYNRFNMRREKKLFLWDDLSNVVTYFDAEWLESEFHQYR